MSFAPDQIFQRQPQEVINPTDEESREAKSICVEVVL
jgi:hypothetical protein